jgi:hypothetical protein
MEITRADILQLLDPLEMNPADKADLAPDGYA